MDVPKDILYRKLQEPEYREAYINGFESTERILRGLLFRKAYVDGSKTAIRYLQKKFRN